MRRHLNFTGRRRLPTSALKVVLKPNVYNGLAFDADVSLPDGLPEDARVYVEASFKRSVMRFDFGTVGCMEHPDATSLSELESTERVLFRLKVVDTRGEHGKIVALLDNVHVSVAPDDELGGRRPILPVNFRKDMGQLVWAVAVDDVSGPELHINADIPAVREWVRTDRVFYSLVFPAVVGEVLMHLIADPQSIVSADIGWRADWLRFLSDATRIPLPDTEDGTELMEWREDVVKEFANGHRAAARLIEELQRRAGDAD